MLDNFRSERIWASKVGLNDLKMIQRVILLGLPVVLTGNSLKTELRFKIYGRLKFGRKKSTLVNLLNAKSLISNRYCRNPLLDQTATSNRYLKLLFRQSQTARAIR